MKEYRQSKPTPKKQIGPLLPLDVYKGAKRGSQKYNRSMAYHIVETFLFLWYNLVDAPNGALQFYAIYNMIKPWAYQ